MRRRQAIGVSAVATSFDQLTPRRRTELHRSLLHVRMSLTCTCTCTCAHVAHSAESIDAALKVKALRHLTGPARRRRTRAQLTLPISTGQPSVKAHKSTRRVSAV